MKYSLSILSLLIALSAADAQGPPPPVPATPTFISASFSGPNPSAAPVILPGAAGQYTYICGIYIDGFGTTNTADTAVTPTVSGLTSALAQPIDLTNGYVYNGDTYNGGPHLFNMPAVFNFFVAMTGSCDWAVNPGDSIVVNVPGAAGNPETAIYVWGYTIGGPGLP